MGSSNSAALPALLIITDWALGEAVLFDRLRAALEVSPRIAVQHRHPGVTARQLLAEARRVAALCARSGNPLFVNGRLDVALAVGAHLHLPAHGLLPVDARAHLPEDRMISCAAHDEAEAREARGASFALVSPVFSPLSKPEDRRAPLGVEGFRKIAAVLPCPAFALGGIDARGAAALGPVGVAVIGAVLHSETPAAAAAGLLKAPPLASSVAPSGA